MKRLKVCLSRLKVRFVSKALHTVKNIMLGPVPEAVQEITYPVLYMLISFTNGLAFKRKIILWLVLTHVTQVFSTALLNIEFYIKQYGSVYHNTNVIISLQRRKINHIQSRYFVFHLFNRNHSVFISLFHSSHFLAGRRLSWKENTLNQFSFVVNILMKNKNNLYKERSCCLNVYTSFYFFYFFYN